MRYSVKAASIATGVGESRLRTWERRYGVPTPKRTETGRRTYNDEDIAVIRRMAELIGMGIPASEAANVLRTEGVVHEAMPARTDEPLHPMAQSIREASARFEEPPLTATIKEAVGELGWPVALDRVLMPGLRSIGEAWGEGSLSPANEHFATEVIRRSISSAIVATESENKTTVKALLACPEDERHELGLLAFSLLLSRSNLQVVYLGADVPTIDLISAIQRCSPDAVCLSATTESALASLGVATRAVVGTRLSLKLYVGGPAFRISKGTPVAGAVLPQSLEAATEVLTGELKMRKRD